MTAAEAAALLGVSERTIRRKIAAGELPSVKAGRARLIPASAVTPSPQDDTAVTAVATSRHDTADAESATVLALVDRIGGLEREVGRLTAELGAAEERLRAIGAGAPTPPGPAPAMAQDTRPWWRRLLGLG